MTDNIEAVWVQIFSKNKNNKSVQKLLIGTCYRPPNQSKAEQDLFLDYLTGCFESIYNEFKCPFVLLGDFNDACCNWNDSHEKSKVGLSLYNLIHSHHLSQLINEPTREDHLLDLLITNCADLVVNSGVGDPLDQLDHLPINGCIKFSHEKPKSFKKFVRSYNIDNLNNLYKTLSTIEWYKLFYCCNDVNILLDIFYNTLFSVLEECVPLHEVIIRPNDKPGMTSLVRSLFRKRDRAHKIAIQTKTIENLINFKKARKLAKNEWRKAKETYNEKIHAKLNDPHVTSKTYWKQIKTFYGKSKNETIPTLIVNGQIYTDAEEKATKLNDYFISQSTLNIINVPKLLEIKLKNSENCIESITTSVEEVYSILSKLSTSKANGSDNISNIVLKYCAVPLADPIAHIINKSLEAGVFPSKWKVANVVPVFKSGDREEVGNYRPISLLSNISKILERVVFTHLYEFFEKNNLLSPKNSGFKKRDNTISQLLHIIHKIHQGLDDGKEICLLFMDVTKAFDRVWHKGLIHKLKNCGVSGPLLKLLSCYLSNRHQRVVLENKRSSLLGINAGVPQGSILGPLLFLVFLNDIELDIESDIFLFADDTSLMKCFSNLNEAEHVINSDMIKLQSWADRWLVKFNPIKTKFILISNKKIKSNLNIFLNGNKIEEVPCYKHLGITFSSDFKWTTHINGAVKRANMKIGALLRIQDTLLRKDKSKIYTTMIRPALEYGGVIYDNCSLADSMKIESVQKFAGRVCTGALKLTNYEKLCHDLKWQSLKSRRTVAKAIFTHKIINKLAPSYLESNFCLKKCLVSGLRNSATLVLPRCRLSSFANSFFPSQTKVWNMLQPEKLKSETKDAFKRSMSKRYFILLEEGDDHVAYSTLSTYFGKILTQIRLGCSPLRQHLFLHNLTDNPFCSNCGNDIETQEHFFLNCIKYNSERTELINKLLILSDDWNNLTTFDKLNLMIRGHKLKHAERFNSKNVLVFKAVQIYLKQTKRFTY